MRKEQSAQRMAKGILNDWKNNFSLQDIREAR
jgi:hypothetical protein